MKAHPEFGIVGVDVTSDVTHCQNEYPFGTWIPADFEQGTPGLAGVALGRAAVICSDVIEHIVNVERFVDDLAKIARAARLTILSTPERARSEDESDEMKTIIVVATGADAR